MNQPLDLDLLRRYDRPGPRYTSYPTAPQFTSAFEVADFIAVAQSAGREPHPRPLSLYVHIPFCESPCLYCGCNRVITRSRDKAAPYLERLTREIERVAPLFDLRKVVQLHFGGGTPNFLSPAQLGALLETLKTRFRFTAAPECELSIEIDPRFVQPADIAALAKLGFNRVSLGVQDFDPEVQRAVNRLQSPEQTFAAMRACRDAGITSINVDLMYGLPRQTLDGFRRTLQAIIEARPTRLAVYGYAHLPQLFKPQRHIDSDTLPDAQTRVSLLSMAIEELTAAGYRYIGMDHFALPDDELVRAQEAGTLQRNFMGYTTHAGCDLLGLGVSAISHIGESFSQNPRNLKDWEAAIDAGRIPVWRGLLLDRDDAIRAEIIERIMCQGEVDLAAIEQRYGIVFWTQFSKARERLASLEADGLVEVGASRIAATHKGRFLLRLIAGCFDRYLKPRSGQEPQTAVFSKVI